MASPRIEYAVLPAGDGPGQDRCFTADGLVVVLDGASAYDPSVSPDASEYVDTLGPALIKQIAGTPGVDLREALAAAIRETAAKLQLIPGQGPSSTVSTVRCGGEALDVMVLGDSPVIVQFADGSQETIVQHPMDHIAIELRQLYRRRLARGDGFDSIHRGILAELQRREAPLRNVDGGYWIAESQPLAASYVSLAARPLSSVSYVVAMTDGASVPTNHLGWEFDEYMSLDAVGLLEVLKSVHRWESTIDPHGQLLPRSKPHDDKTLAIVRPHERRLSTS